MEGLDELERVHQESYSNVYRDVCGSADSRTPFTFVNL